MQNGTDVYVIVYNPLAHARSIIIHLPVTSKTSYTIEEIGRVNSSRRQIMVSAIPTLNTMDHGAPYRVVFEAAKVPPMGASVFKVSMQSSFQKPSVSAASEAMSTTFQRQRSLAMDHESSSDIVASNEYYSAVFDGYVKSHTLCFETILERCLLMDSNLFSPFLEKQARSRKCQLTMSP